MCTERRARSYARTAYMASPEPTHTHTVLCGPPCPALRLRSHLRWRLHLHLSPTPSAPRRRRRPRALRACPAKAALTARALTPVRRKSCARLKPARAFRAVARARAGRATRALTPAPAARAAMQATHVCLTNPCALAGAALASLTMRTALSCPAPSRLADCMSTAPMLSPSLTLPSASCAICLPLARHRRAPAAPIAMQAC